MRIIVHKTVSKFLSSLDVKNKAKTDSYLRKLEQYTYLLPMPYSKMVQNNLYELRVLGKIQVRIFYTFQSNRIILLHAIIKKSNKIPKRDIDTALARLTSLDQ